MKYVTTWLVIPQLQKFKSGNSVSLLCFIENLSRWGNRRSAGFKEDISLMSRSTDLRWVNGILYMLSRVDSLFLDRSNSLKVGATDLISFGTTVRPAFSIMSDFKTTNGARFISSKAPSKLLRVKHDKVCPTVFNWGAFCKLCEWMCNERSLGNPSNALGCIRSNELVKIYIT